MQRYSYIKGNFPREFLLLQGTGCKWKRCKYCDYYNDVSVEPFLINENVLNIVSGITGTLDIINSGSAFELDDKTINLLKKVIIEKNINTIWFESHWMYRHKLKDFASKLGNNIKVKWRTGVETFNTTLRNSLNKGIPSNVSPNNIRKYFEGICLLIGFEGQSLDDIINDVKIAEEYFEYFSVNVFVENSTPIKRDEKLIDAFMNKVYPGLLCSKKVEILLNNTDLGVG